MSVETLRSISEKLREMYRFGRDEQITTEVTISQDEYYIDLGAFGEQSLSIELEEDEFYLDAEAILDKYPIETYEFEGLADELDAFIAEYEKQEAEDDIEVVLKRIEANGGAPLVAAVRAAIAAFQSGIPVSVGPPPEKPLPWPGALRPEIDYTASDFPFRYDPPHGFTWAERNYNDGGGVGPSEAVPVNAKGLGTNEMVLDKVGRVFWIKSDAKDDFSSGLRWRVWHNERDIPGIGTMPEAESFSTDTPPRAIDADGKVIPEDTTVDTEYGEPDFNWQPGESSIAYATIQKLRAKALEAVGQQVNEYGVTYDPLTIPTEGAARRTTEELRIGDDVGGYGRVLKVERAEDGTDFYVLFAGGTTDKRASYNWYLDTIVGWENQPTALSISEAKKGVPPVGIIDFAKVAYDPLTVEVGEDEDTVQSSELRLGDDITGLEFGRVIGVEANDNGGFTITMNRNGTINVQQTSFDEFWSVLPIVGVDRFAQTPASKLGGIVETSVPQYDPLTVEVSGSVSIRANDLRVGDLVTGTGFGRVVTVVEDPAKPGFAILTLNYEGTINTITGYKLDQTWGCKTITGVDREKLPTAFSLSKGAPPAEPEYDVLNVEVNMSASNQQRFDSLRFGDLVTGTSFGRLVGIKKNDSGDGPYTAVLYNTGTGKTNEWPRRPQDTWQVKLIAQPLREKITSAVTLFERSGAEFLDARVPAGVSYDPLTVELGQATRAMTSELRLGDDITGASLGRVTKVEALPNGNFKITMNRNGKENIYDASADRSWNILPIKGVDRASQPTALSLTEGAPPVGKVDYDPLTVPIVERYTDCKGVDLRLGDDVVGQSFGRVVGIEDGKLVLDRDGQRKTISVTDDMWTIYPIDRPDRDSLPTAAALGAPAPPVAAPF